VSAFNDLMGTPAFDLGEEAKPPSTSDQKLAPEDIIVGYKPKSDGTLEPVYFSEDFWDLNLYKPLTARQNYYFFFESFENPQRQEIKELCYLWLNRHASSVSSILYCQPLYFKPFYDFARNHGISIKEALSDEKWIADFVHSAVSLTPATLQNLKWKIKLIRRFRLQGFIDWGPPSEKLTNALNSTNIAYKVGNQTSVIPSRIYCNLITGLSDLLNDFIKQDIANKLITLYEKIDALPYAGGLKGKLAALSTTKKGERKLRNTHTIESLLEDVGLTEWLKKYNHELNLRELDKLVIVVQLAARLWVHCFTGMRDMEVRSLPYVCLGKIESKGKQITVIRGLTSKLTGMGAINTMWVTNDIVQVAVDVAQDIGRYFAAYHGVQIDEGLMPLFPQKGSPGKINSTTDFKPNTGSLDTVWMRLLQIISNITIEESDLKELERFQSFTPDFRKKFKVGTVWPLLTHQLRRSLAVYTARSNKVEIGAMTAQFKHLGLVMQEYYRRGSVWAVNLLESPVQNEYVSGIRGLVELIEINERLKQFDDFEERVINEAGPLAGGAGSVFKRIKRDGGSIILEEDREYTKQAFVDGRTAFKESPIGWCTKREACDKIKITNDTQCIGCENSVFTPKDERKLLNHIEYLKTAKSGYSTGSMFEKHYALQIDKTEKTLAKIRGVNQ
jgi:hypothetical protein